MLDISHLLRLELRRRVSNMPSGSKVDKVYKAVLKTGASKGKAARIAQSKTGQSLKTGKPPKKNK